MLCWQGVALLVATDLLGFLLLLLWLCWMDAQMRRFVASIPDQIEIEFR